MSRTPFITSVINTRQEKTSKKFSSNPLLYGKEGHQPRISIPSTTPSKEELNSKPSIVPKSKMRPSSASSNALLRMDNEEKEGFYVPKKKHSYSSGEFKTNEQRRRISRPATATTNQKQGVDLPITAVAITIPILHGSRPATAHSKEVEKSVNELSKSVRGSSDILVNSKLLKNYERRGSSPMPSKVKEVNSHISKSKSNITISKSVEGLNSKFSASDLSTRKKKSISPKISEIEVITKISVPPDHDEDESIIDSEKELPNESATEINNNVNSYEPTPMQKTLAEMFLPCIDDENYGFPPPISDYIFSIAYGLSCKLNFGVFSQCVSKLVKNHRILSTEVTRNTKILDSDVIFNIDGKNEDVPVSRFLSLKNFQFTSSESVISQLWCLRNEIMNEISQKKETISGFKVYVVDSSVGEYEQFLLIVGSQLTVDGFSISFLSRRLLENYFENIDITSRAQNRIEHAEEFEAFEDYAKSVKFVPKDMEFWKHQCIEIQKDELSSSERKKLENQLRLIDKEKQTLLLSLDSASKQTTAYQSELARLREQRMEIERGLVGEGPTSHFVNPLTGEITVVSEKTKKALIATVLGVDATGENVLPLLVKHDVSTEIQRKLNASKLKLEDFASLTEGNIMHLHFSTKDKRKVLALAEFVRNRIYDCVQEQGKVKFGLEREIAKTARTLSKSKETLGSTQMLFDSKEDLEFRLKNILHPALEEKKIESASLRGGSKNLKGSTVTLNEIPRFLSSMANFFDGSSNGSTDGVPAGKYGVTKFTIDNDILKNLRQFKYDWTNNIRNKKKNERKKKDKLPSLTRFDSDNDSLLESDAEGDGKLKNDKILKDSTADAVCLTAFGVLLKHVVGKDKFLVGLVNSLRRPGLIVGPLTDIVPVKFDLSRENCTFSGVFKSLYKIFKQAKRYNSACPMQMISAELGVSVDFPFQFQFINQEEYKEWEKLGVPIDYFLSPQLVLEEKIRNVEVKRIWLENTTDNFDIRFVMVELSDRLECAVQYRIGLFDPEKISKWIVKFESTLEGIDSISRDVLIASIISR